MTGEIRPAPAANLSPEAGGRDAADRVIVFDTTLRDGEQSPGIALDVAEKVEIAEQLARLGVDVIEAGFPVASQGDFEAVAAVAASVRGPVVCGLSRTALADIDRCWAAIEAAPKRRLHTFIATSEIHMQRKLRMTPDQVKAEVVQAVTYARRYTDDVEFSPEDASRSDFAFMCEVLQLAVDCGATTLNIPDTVGYTTPTEWGKRLAAIRARVTGDYVLSSHCHNDLGLAVANSLAAIEAGARQVECTVNGIGERAGNAAVEEIAMTLAVRPEAYGGAWVNINTTELARSSRLVSRLTGYPVQYNKAVVGRNAFAHESGIHQHGVMADKSTYEIMDPAAVGAGETQLVLGKHSGRHAFAARLADLGHPLTGEALNAAFARFKELADRKVAINDDDLDALVADLVGDQVDSRPTLVRLACLGGTDVTPHVSVTVNIDGEHRHGDADGDGMVDAACRAIYAAVGIDAELSAYSVTAVTAGDDALADVAVRLTSEGRQVPGRAVAADVVEASARAVLNALARLQTPAGPEVDRPGSLRGVE